MDHYIEEWCSYKLLMEVFI